MSGGRRRHQYPTGRIDWPMIGATMRDRVYREQALARMARQRISERLALRRAEGRIAASEALSRRASRRRARRKIVRESRRANR